MTSSRKRLITTAQYNASVNKALLKSADTYRQDNDSKLLILPTSGISITEEPELDSSIALEEIVNKPTILNSKIKIEDFGVRPQQINPLTGLDRLAQGDRSYIMPGTKQVLKYVANSNDVTPKAIMTTGAITNPRYNMNHRTGRIATRDHEYGFVAVELVGNKYFHFRHITSQKDGKFFDLGWRYDGDKDPEYHPAEALIVGDLHPYDTDKTHERNTLEQMVALQPKRIILHDAFNGKSISHHYKGKNKDRWDAYQRQGLDLENELIFTAKAIEKYAEATDGNVYITPSNHDDHLARYLDEGRFIDDKGNDRLGALLYAARLDGENPVQAGIDMLYKLPDNVVFLRPNEDLKVLGYQLGNHGHLGANGGRGSPRSIEIANGKSVTAHGHSAYKIRDTHRVGTSTHLRLSYNNGYSNWTQTNGVLYPDGHVQLLNTIKKNWKAD